MQITLNVCLRLAPTASGCTTSEPSAILCATPAVRPGIASPSRAVVRKIFLPQTIGDEWPKPSIGVFHLTFFLSLHSSGRPFSADTPCPSGPRHSGQFVEPVLAAIEVDRIRVAKSAV